jgi:hypothetical protein
MPKKPTSTSVSETASSVTVTSVKQFDSPAAFETYVLSSLNEVENYHDFLFADVPGSWGEAVFQLIDEKIKCL